MLKFKDILTESEELVLESGERMTKAKWQSAMDMVPKGERDDFMKFSASVQKLYGITTDSQKDYAKVQAAFKSLRGQKKPAPPKASGTKVEAPKPAPAAKPVEAPKPVPKEPAKPAVKFDTSGLTKKYNQVLSLLSDIQRESSQIKKDFAKIRNGRQINNLDDPELYALYVSVENVGYVADIVKLVDSRMFSIKNLAKNAAAVK